MPISVAEHIQMRNCKCKCEICFKVVADEKQYHLSDFSFENIDVEAENMWCDNANAKPFHIDNSISNN